MYGEFSRIISRMWKRKLEKTMLSDDYTAQNTWRIAESIDAKSRWRGCNAAIVRPSAFPPLSVWLNVSLSPFSALSLSYFHESLSRLSYSLFLLHYIQPIAEIFACLSFPICSRFLPRFVYFVFLLCKIQPPILTPRITIFSFREIHEILRLDGQVQLASRIFLRMLCAKSRPHFSEIFTLTFNSDKTKGKL